jgi:hypothetical protein
MLVARKPTHIAALQSRQVQNKIAQRAAKSFAEISEAMHRHSD